MEMHLLINLIPLFAFLSLKFVDNTLFVVREGE